MHDSPRLRRLRNDLAALERLKAESSVFDFRAQGNPPEFYRVRFQGKGLHRDGGKVRPRMTHEVEIKLGSSYPRSIPEIRWVSPIHHPNISEIGMVCLGGYGTHWVPSVQLDELCMMLWDMARYHNYDVRSPYNRDAALWAGNQTAIPFPTDPRPIRDLREARGRVETETAAARPVAEPSRVLFAAAAVDRVRRFLDRRDRSAEPPPPLIDEVVIVEEPPTPHGDGGILFIE